MKTFVLTRVVLLFATLLIASGLLSCNDLPGKIYVSIYGDDEISVLDGSTNDVIDHIPVGKGPAILLETPNHAKLYTANWVDNSVSSVTLATRAVSSIPLAGRPLVIAMSPDGKQVYAGLFNQIVVIDTTSDTVVQSMSMSSVPMSIVVSPDSTTLYVAFIDNTVAALAATTGAIVKPPIAVGSFPAWATMAPDGSKVYTLNFISGDVTVVDTALWQVAATIPTGAMAGTASLPIIGATTPDGKVLGVTNIGSVDVSLIDTNTNQVVQTLKMQGRPLGIGFSPSSKRGYITDFGNESLAYNPVDLILAGLQGTPFPFEIPGRLTVFDPATGATIDTTVLGAAPSSIVAIP